MSRFAEYADYDYLPRKAQLAGVGDAFELNPEATTSYLEAKKYKFEPDDKADLFSRFLMLQQNPSALAAAKMKLPPKFEAFTALAGLGT